MREGEEECMGGGILDIAVSGSGEEVVPDGLRTLCALALCALDSRLALLPIPFPRPAKEAKCCPTARMVEASSAQSSRPYMPYLTTNRTAKTMMM